MLSLLKSFTKRQLARKFSQNTHFRYIMLTKTLLRPIQIPSTHTHKIANLAKKGTTWGGAKKGNHSSTLNRTIYVLRHLSVLAI